MKEFVIESVVKPCYALPIETLQEIYGNGELLDLEFLSKKKGCEQLSAKRAHSVIMALVSPVLRRMISWEQARCKANGRVIALQLEEVDSNVLEAFVDFVYTGSARIRDDVEELVAIGRLADRLDVTSLRETVIRESRKMLDVSTCVAFLNASRDSGLPELEELCFQFALDHYELVAHTPSFSSLDQGILEDLIADDRLRVRKEEDIVMSIELWLEAGREDATMREEGEEGVSNARAGEEQEAVEEGYDRSDSSTGKEDEKEGVDQERRLPKHFSWRMISSIRWNLIENKFVEDMVVKLACRKNCSLLNQFVGYSMKFPNSYRSQRGGSGPGYDVVRRLRITREMKHHAGAVAALSYHHGLIVSASHDGSVKLTNLTSGKTEGGLSFQSHPRESQRQLGAVYAMLVHGDSLVTAGQMKQGTCPLNVWSLTTRRHLKELEGHQDAVMCLSKNEVHLFSGSWDRTVRQWDLSSFTCQRVIQSQHGPVLSICSLSLAIVAAGLESAWHLVLDEEGEEREADPRVFFSGPDPVTCVAVGSGPRAAMGGSSWIFRPEERIFSGHKSGAIRVWCSESLICVANLQCHDDAVSALTAYGSWLVTGSMDGSVRMWNFTQAFVACRGDGEVQLAAAEERPQKRESSKTIVVGSEVKSLHLIKTNACEGGSRSADGFILCGCQDRSVRLISDGFARNEEA
uniref:BTB domain-containing protein n=1 Tax=Hanusia phi TaxID=3032 RepID=A0A7S0E0T4_9CRYP|mmetsp:Transcript_14424/g.33178  ORF Transcript_14424/g.33178 Transcript_14424/m.33178 type:complete len:690 (+) Transcript_14424:62-2131(+)